MITRLLTGLTFLLVFLARAIEANTEKVIFLAPSLQSFSESQISIKGPSTNVLTLEQSTIRTSLPVAFPTSENPRGLVYWYLLRHLNAGQRYEVRVCWAASQPTEFWLNVFGINEIDRLPSDLLNTLGSESTKSDPLGESILALRIQAAADFFTSNQTLMRHPPSVDVDIILDPYLLNVFPTSLLPTAVYISLLALIGYFVSGIIWRYLESTIEVQKLRTD